MKSWIIATEAFMDTFSCDIYPTSSYSSTTYGYLDCSRAKYGIFVEGIQAFSVLDSLY